MIKKGMTLMELLVTVTIIGIVSSIAIPNFTVSVERSHVRDATTQLISIWAANQIFRAQNGRYWPLAGQTFPLGGAGGINDSLALGIIPNGMTYSCTGAGAVAPGTFSCTATRGGYVLTVTDAVISAPPLVLGSNPSCAGCP